MIVIRLHVPVMQQNPGLLKTGLVMWLGNTSRVMIAALWKSPMTYVSYPVIFPSVATAPNSWTCGLD